MFFCLGLVALTMFLLLGWGTGRLLNFFIGAKDDVIDTFVFGLGVWIILFVAYFIFEFIGMAIVQIIHFA